MANTSIIEKAGKILTLTILAASVLLILAVFFWVLALQGNTTLYLKDIEGDRKALSDLVISGCLQDKRHAQNFEISGGELSHRFKYYGNIKNVQVPQVRYGNGAADDKYQYWYTYYHEVASGADTRSEYTTSASDKAAEIYTTYANKADVIMQIQYNQLDSRKGKGYPQKNQLRVRTGVRLESDRTDLAFEYKKTYYQGGGFSETKSFRNPNEIVRSRAFGIALLDGKQYFTVHTVLNKGSGKAYRGESGIYSVEEYGSWTDESSEKGTARKIASIDLNKNDVEVMGLHAVNSRLVAVMLVDGVLTFRAYNPQSGNMTAELPVPQLKTAGDMLRYDPYINGDTLSLNIINSEKYSGSLTVVSVEVSDTIKLLHYVDSASLDSRGIDYIGAVVPANGKLTVLAALRDIDGSIPNDRFYPLHFMLFVFDSAERSNALLYAGEIVTDADDDFISHRKRPNMESSYDYYDNRNIANVSVKGAL